MKRTGRSFTDFLIEYKASLEPSEAALFEAWSAYYRLVSELMDLRKIVNGAPEEAA